MNIKETMWLLCRVKNLVAMSPQISHETCDEISQPGRVGLKKMDGYHNNIMKCNSMLMCLIRCIPTMTILMHVMLTR